MNTTAWSALYSWIDARGVTHFADQPNAGASALVIATEQTVPTMSVAPTSTVKQAKRVLPTAAPLQTNYYQTLAIIQPVNAASLFDNLGALTLTLTIQPALRAQDALWVQLDKQRVAATCHQQTCQILGIAQGAHTVQVQILNATATVMATSNAVTLFMHHASVRQATRQPN